jgi:hypothetical protein
LNKKTLAVVLALGAIASVGYFGGSYVLASDNNPMHTTLVSRIAQKFNLNEADVEAVFEAVRDERQDEMKSQREERLIKLNNYLRPEGKGRGKGMGMMGR